MVLDVDQEDVAHVAHCFIASCSCLNVDISHTLEGSHSLKSTPGDFVL